jgi:hypothetical protein
VLSTYSEVFLCYIDIWFLTEYDSDIKHIKGKKNKVVDALSRRVHDMHATTISTYKYNLKDRNMEASKSDK